MAQRVTNGFHLTGRTCHGQIQGRFVVRGGPHFVRHHGLGQGIERPSLLTARTDGRLLGQRIGRRQLGLHLSSAGRIGPSIGQVSQKLSPVTGQIAEVLDVGCSACRLKESRCQRLIDGLNLFGAGRPEHLPSLDSGAARHSNSVILMQEFIGKDLVGTADFLQGNPGLLRGGPGRSGQGIGELLSRFLRLGQGHRSRTGGPSRRSGWALGGRSGAQWGRRHTSPPHAKCGRRGEGIRAILS